MEDKVELERSKAAAVKSVAPRPAAAPRTASGEKVISKPAAAGPGAAVKAPLPGVVLSIPVKVGDTVKAADTVVVLEDMLPLILYLYSFIVESMLVLF